jgi:SHS2 domain-containing protein
MGGNPRSDHKQNLVMSAPPILEPGTNEYFEHDADIGVVGRGATLEESFEAAARATFALMSDLDAVRPVDAANLEFEEADRELALVRWLNLLLALSHERGLVFSRFWIERDGVRWRGGASGEPWGRDFERGTEVKGATLTMLSVTQTGAGWEARCVVDV